VSKGANRDVHRFDQWAPEYDQDRLQQRFFGPVHAGLDVQGWAPVFDLDLLPPVRRRPPPPPVGRMPLVTAVIARAS